MSYVFELKSDNTVRIWDKPIEKIEDWDKKLLFIVSHANIDYCANSIKRAFFPTTNRLKHIGIDVGNLNFFGLDRSILLADETDEIKAIKITDIWKFLEAGATWEAWEKIQAEMKEAEEVRETRNVWWLRLKEFFKRWWVHEKNKENSHDAGN